MNLISQDAELPPPLLSNFSVNSSKLKKKNSNNTSYNKLMIDIPEIATIKNLEAYFIELFKDNSITEDDFWRIDFSKCLFIELTSLVYLASLINGKVKKNQDICIKLPEDERVFDFLVVWEFLELLQDTLKRELKCLVESESLNRYENRKNANNLNYSDSKILSGQEVRILSKNFFALSTFKLASFLDYKLAVKNLTDKWQQDNILRVLSRHLKIPGASNELPSRVIFEAATNATLHPKANFIVTASRFEGSASNKQFTLVIWDDGENIVQTLRGGIKNKTTGNAIPPLFRSRRKYTYTIIDENGNKLPKKSINADYDNFDLNTPDELIFIASTFLGITREIDGVKIESDNKNNNENNLIRGTGLTYLTNYALDICGGSVTFRINNLFMNIKPAKINKRNRLNSEEKHEIDYEVKIIRYSNHMPAFIGNMLTIRLPLA